MSVTLNPGVTHTIKITDEDYNDLHTQTFKTEEECKSFLNTYGQSKVGKSQFDLLFTAPSILKPTEYFENLFFPTVKHLHSNLNAPLDLLTLPIRVLGTPIELFVDCILPEKPHPLATLLKRDDLSSVNVLYTKETVQEPTVEKKVTKTIKETVTGKQKLFLKSIPCQEETKMNFTTRTFTYKKDPKSKKWEIHDCLILKPGFQATVEITDLKNQVLHTQKFQSTNTFFPFIHTYTGSQPGWSFFQMATSTLRTGLADFSKDFFLPTTTNFSPFCLPIDLVTLPIRAFTLPYRIYQMKYYPEKPHPLSELLKTSVSEVMLKTRWEEVDNRPRREGDVMVTHQTVATAQQLIRLKTLPGSSSSCHIVMKKNLCARKVRETSWWVFNTKTYSRTSDSFAC